MNFMSFLYRHRCSVAFCVLVSMAACGGGGGGTQAPPSPPPPPPPPVTALISTFTASQPVIPMGSSATLTWALDKSVTTATLDGKPLGGIAGNVSITPKFRQSYTLVATDGQRTETKVVKVAAQGLDLIAGDLGGKGCLDGIGRDARFSWPWLLASDSQGNLLVADPNFWYSVRKVTPAGMVTTLAGNSIEAGYVDGPSSLARFGQIAGLTVAPDGTIIVVDFGNKKIRKIASDGTVSTFVDFSQGGSGAFQYNPAQDASGNLYVSDHLGGKIQRISPTGIVSQFAGGFTYPGDLTIRPDGSLLVIETFDGTLWSVDAGGTRTSVPLTFDPTDTQSGYISGIYAMTLDSSGGLYLSTLRGLLYRGADDLVHTVTAWKESHFLGDAFPRGLAWMKDRLALGVSNFGGEIATLAPGGHPAPLAGWGAGGVFLEDGVGATARFASPCSVALGSQGEIYIADQDTTGAFAGVIRKVLPNGAVSTLRKEVGWGYLSGWADATHLLPIADGRILFSNGNSIAAVTQAGDVSAYLTGAAGQVTGLCKDVGGNIFFGEGTGRSAEVRVRKLSSTGQLSIVADLSAGLRSIAGLSIDASGRLLAADPLSQAVWSVTQAGGSAWLAGVDRTPGFIDGTFGLGRLREPRAVALHPSGRILICDRGNRAIRTLTSDGVLATLGGSVDRPGIRLGLSGISFSDPTDMVVTPEGDLVITDGFAVVRWTAPFGE